MDQREQELLAKIQIDDTWREVLRKEFTAPYFLEIKKFLQAEKQKGHVVFPPGKFIFNAYNLTPFDKVKVVILGQDPYHGKGQAHGLCFSVQHGVKAPPSLVNIFKELKKDMNIDPPSHGNLESWAGQGVFLLNAILTVEKDKPASHQHIGWQNFTDATIRCLNSGRENLVFMLWGNYAQQKASMIDSEKHLVLRTTHPSPFSANNGFLGSGHFSKTNQYLMDNNITPIDWKL